MLLSIPKYKNLFCQTLKKSRFLHAGFYCIYFQDRPYSYETEDLRRINVMLNNNDVSDYLKISPSGLEVSYITGCFVMYKTIMYCNC